MDAATGDQIRKYSTGSSYIASITISNGFVYVASSHGIHAIKPEP